MRGSQTLAMALPARAMLRGGPARAYGRELEGARPRPMDAIEIDPGATGRALVRATA